MMNASSGYVGWSMSRRAAAACEDGEMPKSKWTKKDELFHTFLYNSSWHHTSKFFNETDFYAIDEDALADRSPEMSDRQLAEREAARAAELELRAL